AANAGPAAARARRFSGHLLLLRPDHDGYAGGLARPAGGGGTPRNPDPGTPRAGARSPRLRRLPGVELLEMPDQPGTLTGVPDDGRRSGSLRPSRPRRSEPLRLRNGPETGGSRRGGHSGGVFSAFSYPLSRPPI